MVDGAGSFSLVLGLSGFSVGLSADFLVVFGEFGVR